MATRRGIERSVAAGVLLLAAVLAWMIVDRPKETPPAPRIVAEPPPTPDARVPEASPAVLAAALAIELVEISEPPPIPTAVVAPQPVPTRPASIPQHAAKAPPPPAAPAVPVASQTAIETPAPEIVPLRPATPPPQPVSHPAVLPPEPAPIREAEIVPLRPTPPSPKPHPDVVERPAPTRPPQPEVTPMQPSPPVRLSEPEKKVAVRAPAPLVPAPRPAPKAAPEKAPPKADPPMNVTAVVGEGRAFLKILEQGAGPSIEIRWPSDSSQRDRLYDALVQCLGMRTGLLDGEGRLYLGEGQKGQPSTLDGERYSGFVRRPEGAIARDEEREIGRVRSYHQVRASAFAARIFPRRVDAYLIGGLRQLVGENYLKTKSIRAAYRLKNGQAIVESIVADGRRIDGVIDLSAVATGCSL